MTALLLQIMHCPSTPSIRACVEWVTLCTQPVPFEHTKVDMPVKPEILNLGQKYGCVPNEPEHPPLLELGMSHQMVLNGLMD